MNVVKLVIFFLPFCAALAGTPQEESFLKTWAVHARSPKSHAEVIDACQRVMDKSSTLGEWLPAVKTLAAWHLLASGNRDDAKRVFESALLKGNATHPVARFADIMAKRWLTRMDVRDVTKALRAYYADHVEYPSGLAPLFNVKANPPPKTDRFGDAWAYRLESLSRLKGLSNQKFSLYSSTLGRDGTPLKAFPFDVYSPGRSASLLGVKTLTPLTIEFEATSPDGKRERGVSGEAGRPANGVRFLKLSSDRRFALMIDGTGDFWIVASPAR